MRRFALELRYALRERAVVTALAFTFVVATVALLSGEHEAREQRTEIASLITETHADQHHVISQQSDPGSAAYYVFHLTYGNPESLTFAALGTREDLPWQHRLRMLALEGQIYEADTGNPELSRLGRLDFAFVTSVLVPLVLILLLFDLNAREQREGRFELLLATSTSGRNTLLIRACARTALLFVVTVLPFGAMAAIASAPLAKSLAVALVVCLHLLFWLLICRAVARKFSQASSAATILLACWLLFTAAVPATARIVVEALIPVPAGGELLLAQREAVNDAWDLPKPATMQPFVASHPQWRDYAEVDQTFDWKWYYAFQQMGDEFVGTDSAALRTGIARRDRWMGIASVASPSLATERWLTHLAGTDRIHHQRYLRCVRDFHATLRDFHYPMLFGLVEYSDEAMAGLPKFRPCDS